MQATTLKINDATRLYLIPLINLCVIYLDKIGTHFSGVFSRLKLSSYRLNLIFMSVWILIFIAWYSSGHVGRSHPGAQSQFWAQACSQDLRKACKTQLDLTLAECDKGNAYACAKLGDFYKYGTGVSKDELKAYEYVGRACQMGLEKACELRHEYIPGK